MNEEEMMGMADMGVGGVPAEPMPSVDPAPAAEEGGAEEADPAAQFTEAVIEAIRPVIMDVVNQVLAAAQGAGM